MKRLALLPLTALLFCACTGTVETLPALRLAVLEGGGTTLRTVTTGGGGDGVRVTPAPVLGPSVTVPDGVTVDPLPGRGTRLLLTRRGGLESRDANLADVRPFAPAFDAPGFTPPCFVTTALNAARDRILSLSQCETGGVLNGTQQLALYRTDGTLVWRAALGGAAVVTGPDVPPVRVAAVRRADGVDVAVVARPALGGGSEVLRVAATVPGADRAEPSQPVPTPAIRDLAPAPNGTSVYAATDTGVRTLGTDGAPGEALAAFGEGRADRVWTSAGSGVPGRTLIAAWRDPRASGLGSEPLRLWDASGPRNEALTVNFFADLRDLTFAPDGFLYALSATALTGYDTVIGLGSGTAGGTPNWRPVTLLSGLNDARAVTWLVP
ncbi:hypothetical protein RDMS_12575 [Deinococcus sp. RL]|uniref:hypothetical protein n=1 Tax=Deinococcus sp. RL TaxID=1489678 RepID=UPI0004D7E1D8|nr:hypothetical protein [Deinococcus sp. RL]KEF33348.1 hypothetical protein RDMS_12575 [Deinococcus sp. RL]